MGFKSAVYGHEVSVGPSRDGLVVRPDLAQVRFSFAGEGYEPEAGRRAMREAVALVESAVAQVAGARLVLDGFNSGARPLNKSSGPPRTELRGTIDLPLTETQDFWARAALDCALVEVGTRTLAELKRQRSPLEAHFGGVLFTVEDPERYRPALVQRFTARARGLIEALSTPEAPLVILRLDGNGPVEVRLDGPLEAEVSLALSARFGVRSESNG